MTFLLRSTTRFFIKAACNPSVFSGPTLARVMSSLPDYKFETLKVSSPKDFVFHVEINRPQKRNAMNKAFWREMVECFDRIAKDPDCRAVLFSGSGKIFTAGLDLGDAADVLASSEDKDVGRKAFMIRDTVERYQASFTAIEKCPKPVIAAVHNACVGGGVDLITACDIRYCTEDAWFQIKEIDLGMAADVGTLQRLPKVVGNDSLIRELAYTGRQLFSSEAKECGLVSRVFEDREKMIEGGLQTASLIASKSPVAVQGIKINLVYTRDHTVQDSLNFVATWNLSMLQSEDVMKAVMAGMQKENPNFSKL